MRFGRLLDLVGMTGRAARKPAKASAIPEEALELMRQLAEIRVRQTSTAGLKVRILSGQCKTHVSDIQFKVLRNYCVSGFFCGQGESMLDAGPAVRITIHLNQDISSRTDFLHNEILSFLYKQEVSGATLMKPYAGFGFHRHMHVAGAGGVEGEHLPVRIEFIEKKEKIESLLPELYELVTDGLIEANDTTILKVASQEMTKPSRS
jgi:uncharacterized protein